MFTKYLPLLVAGLSGLANAATNDEWAARSIYQIITDRYARSSSDTSACNINNYCGGTWAGIAQKLDYIQNMGFTAIQISPINENIVVDTAYGQAYHGYWSKNLYTLNPNFGTADDLKNLVTELHKRNMLLMVDVVSYEMAASIGDGNMTASTVIDYSVYYPFNDAKYYHPYCPILDWNNVTEYQDCWLGYQIVATPDLKTEDSVVSGILGTWIKELVANYSLDGIRIDGAKQINYDFFSPFASAAGVYAMSEVDDGDAAFTCKYQNLTATPGGLENYPVYFQILAAFTAGEMSKLVDMISSVRQQCSQPQYLANFIENQDNQRFASYTTDLALAENAIAFTILADGIPKMYYGQEQHLTGNYSPYNRQPLWEATTTPYDTTADLYVLTSKLNKIRNHAIAVDSNYVTNTSTILHTDASTYVTRKGVNGAHIISVLSNQGTTGGSYTLSVSGAADAGTNLTEITGCTTLLAGTNGTIVVDMKAGQPRVFFPTFNMKNSGLCGYENATATASGTASSTSATATSSKKSAGVRSETWIGLAIMVAGAISALISL